MKFAIMLDHGLFAAPEIIETHEGDETDARRVLEQWMNDDDIVFRTEHEKVIVLSITGGEGDSEIIAVLKKEA